MVRATVSVIHSCVALGSVSGDKVVGQLQTESLKYVWHMVSFSFKIWNKAQVLNKAI